MPQSATQPATNTAPETTRALFRRGFVGLMPLWTGAIPVGIAYAVAARGAGLSFFQTELMSLTVFSAAAQLSAVALLASGSPVVVVMLTALSLNLQAFLLGLTAARADRAPRLRRLLTAYFLTDGAFAVAVAGGRIRLPVLLGAGVSMFGSWNVGTLIGASAGAILPDLAPVGIDFVAPLTFLAVLVPLVKSRPALLAVLVAALTALVLKQTVPDLTVLGAGLTGSVAGGWASSYGRREPAMNDGTTS